MGNVEKLFPHKVELVMQERFGEKKAHALLDVLSELVTDYREQGGEFLTARRTKEDLAHVMNSASLGKPQLIKRANDELPLILMSLDSVMAVLEHEDHPPRSFWDLVKNDMLPVDAPLQLCETPREKSDYFGAPKGPMTAQ